MEEIRVKILLGGKTAQEINPIILPDTTGRSVMDTSGKSQKFWSEYHFMKKEWSLLEDGLRTFEIDALEILHGNPVVMVEGLYKLMERGDIYQAEITYENKVRITKWETEK